MIDPEIEFKKVEKMLYRLAWNCHLATGKRVSFDEAKSEAYWAFMKCCESYTDNRGTKFSTWVYFKVYRHLKTFVTKLANSKVSYCEIKEEAVGAAPPERSRCLEILNDLSFDAQKLVELLVESPGELLEVSVDVTPKQFLANAKEFLGFTQGMSQRDLDRCEREIAWRFNQVWAS